MSEGFTLTIPLDELKRLARENAIKLNLPIDVERIGVVARRGSKLKTGKKPLARLKRAPSGPAPVDSLRT
jgi:hypothetical protein